MRPRGSSIGILFLAGISAITLQAWSATAEEPWPATQVMKPDELARVLSAPDAPLVLQTGVHLLYRNGHIPRSLYTGPARGAEGLQKLEAAVAQAPKNRTIVLYCGCCPWNDCPNVRPAFRKLISLGFKDVRVLYLPTNFQKDWADRGFPVAKGEGS
jgi:hypothetical protein